jgi:type I restriction enzyme S subunit
MFPEGWDEKTFNDLLNDGDLASIQDGNHGDIHPKAADFVSDGVPFVMARDLKGGTIDFSGCSFITQAQADSLRIGHAYPGDVLISHKGTIGNVAVVPDNYDMVMLTPQVTLYRVSSGGRIDSKYLRAFLQSERYQARFLALAFQSTRNYLGITQQKKFTVPLPPLPEQRKIAEILSTWDAAIEKAEALLATAKAQKRALMQSLLTGKRRFPEFEGQEWKEVRLGDVGVISSAGVDKKIEDGQPKVRLLNFLDVFRREFIFDHELDHVVSAPPAKLEQCNVQRGDVFFTPSSETRDEIAIPAVAAEDMEGVCYSYHVVRFRLSEPWDLNFRAYVFQTDHFKRQAYKLGDGSGQRYVISQGNFRNMTVRVPSVAEQAKIGAVLKAASDEENELGSEITKLRIEKKALMQQLLTGKRRVAV